MRSRKFLGAAGCFAVAIALILTGALAAITRAQTTGPQVYITWKTVGGSAPASYSGKILPKTGSQILASVEVLSNGKLVGLGSQIVYWYLDDNFLGGGTGKQTISFNAPGNTEIMSLRVTIPNYPGGSLINTAHIRMVSPQAVIVAPYPNGIFSGTSIKVHAAPYYFTAAEFSKLVYAWAVNGQAVTTEENPQDLLVNLTGSTPAGYPLTIDLGVQPGNNPSAGVRSSATLTKSQ